jgi:hypothetical protein
LTLKQKGWQSSLFVNFPATLDRTIGLKIVVFGILDQKIVVTPASELTDPSKFVPFWDNNGFSHFLADT